MAWTVVLQLIPLFCCCVSGAYLQYGSTRLSDPQPNVTLTVGATNQRVYCVENTEPLPTSIEWYNPQGQLVSKNNRKVVNQVAGTGGGRASVLTFQSYQQSQGGKYKCRVAGPGNNSETLPVYIGSAVSTTQPSTEPSSMPSTEATSEHSTTTLSRTTVLTPTQPPLPSKVMGIRVTPSVQNTSPILTVSWQALASGAVIYTVKYSTQPGEANIPPEGALEVTGISGTSTTLTALERATTYYIWVMGVSVGGEGPHSDKKSGVTYDNVPHPTDVSVSVVALNKAGSVRVTWSRPRLGPGQVITGYSVQYRRSGTTPYTTRSVSGSSTTSYTITNLNLGTVYEVRVASEGPLGLSGYCCESGKQVTTYNNPGPIFELHSFEKTNTSVNITWRPPKDSNGNIVAYVVEHGVYQNESTTTVRVHVGRPIYTVIQALNPGVPYTVTVRASTKIGKGEPVSIVVFSLEQAPTAQVSNVKVKRVNNNRAARVSWTPLTLNQARGFPVYFVTYQPSSQVGRLVRSVNTVNTTDSSVIISDLEQTTEYTITVDVGTAGGKHLSLRGPVNVTLAAVLPTESSGTGAVAGAVVAVVGLLLLTGTAIVVVIALVLRHKAKGMSFKPDVTADNEERHKAPPYIDPVQHWQADCEVVNSESIEMTQVQATNDSQAITDSPPQTLHLVMKCNFSKHVKAMHEKRDCGFEKEFQTIATIPDGLMDIAKANSSKNRYQNIHTYDASRVILSVPDSDGSDYINASYINGYRQRSAYIASQGPNALTLSDFIQMIWDQKPPVVVMLTRLFEKGKSKCERYWCDEMNEPFEIPVRGFTVTVTGKKVFADYEIRDMAIRSVIDQSAKPLKLKHFFFTAWPDHGVPQHPYSLVKFIQHVRKMLQSSPAPLVVHCSAGVGRTGTFIAVDAMMQRLKEKDDLNIYNFVTQMRTKRTFMVQNLGQYAFIHDALNDYLRCGNTAVVAHELRSVITDLQTEDPQAKCSGFEQQFKLLQELSQVPCTADINFAKKSRIMKRNRYKDRFPYSTDYLHLAGKAGHEASKGAVTYYNASFVDGYSVPRAFIAAQSPMSHTKGDFWELVWQFRTPTIVLLTNFMEGTQEACVNLWPATENAIVNQFEVACNEFQPCRGYDVIKLDIAKLTSSSSTRLEVTAFHFKKWPRDGNPETLPLLEMMGKVEKARQKKDKAALVMCDDGMSRTGVFIAAMCEVERVKVEGEVDIFQTIKAMRKKRPHMVYNKEQYTLCFELLQAYLDSFDTYANFKDL